MKTSVRNTRKRRLLFISTAARAILLAVVWGLFATVPAHAKPGPDQCEGISFGPANVIALDTDRADTIFAADLDGDGDTDILALAPSFENDKIVWYENTDGLGTFGPPQIIATNAYEIHSIFVADLDGDGDTDVLSASGYDDKIAWYENTDGMGTFGPQQIITADANGATSVFAADVDGDGDTDVLSASWLDGKIAWYENTDGLGDFGAQQVITTDAAGANSVFAADLDGDGDIDVLSASAGRWFEDSSKVAWYENTDGLGTFGPPRTISTGAQGLQSVFSADFDGDGDADVLSGSGHGLAWHENTDGRGTFGPQRIITNDGKYFIRYKPVFAVDLDGDGDADVLSCSNAGDYVTWYENTDGLGTFGPQQLVSGYDNYCQSVFPADVNGDGAVDVLSASSYLYAIAWYENQPDCNGNGTNDGCDIADGASLDCNGNGRPDECEIADETSEDCDADGLLDECEPDCNNNRHPDDCDIADGTSMDCDGDGVPSECEEDCNNNGQPDDCDIANGTSADCNFTGVPDICELGRGFAPHPITTSASEAMSVFAIDLDGDGDTDQGQRTLSPLFRKDLHQELVVPASHFALPFDAVL